jgi:hypothetical protein
MGQVVQLGCMEETIEMKVEIICVIIAKLTSGRVLFRARHLQGQGSSPTMRDNRYWLAHVLRTSLLDDKWEREIRICHRGTPTSSSRDMLPGPHSHEKRVINSFCFKDIA